jgi:hypothetical protein
LLISQGQGGANGSFDRFTVSLARFRNRDGDQQSAASVESQAVLDETGRIGRRVQPIRSLESARRCEKGRKIGPGPQSSHANPLRFQILERFANVQDRFDLINKNVSSFSFIGPGNFFQKRKN